MALTDAELLQATNLALAMRNHVIQKSSSSGGDGETCLAIAIPIELDGFINSVIWEDYTA